ncbi:glycosyltransferase family 4 protein [Mammaliicoccus lentus]|uniref:glycosyltransferase family 4 protein n=1 Tax=Mammaliicoccus lentus TaxID=42858 RepID=UPI001FE6CE9F|nr:glycosyltransferase family 4 protein [Mammaliicoccus lentus]WQL56002.1 glycosyltransferase family 4 protein [Mammaliicoccus lentus]
MKILLITQNFYPELGSAANRTYVIFKLLNNSKHELNVLTTTPSYPSKSLFSDNTYFHDRCINSLENQKIYRLKIKRRKQSNSFFSRIMYFKEEFFRLRVFLKRHKNDYDYVYVTSPNIFMAWATLFFKKKNMKYILEIRDLWPDSANQVQGINIKFLMPFLKFLEKRMYNLADKIVINNLSFQKHIDNKLKTKKPMYYLPNGVQQKEIQKHKKYNSFTAIYTGNIGHAQDLNKLIKIAHELNSANIPLIAITYGVKAANFRESVKNLKYVQLKQPMSRENCLKEIAKSHISISVLKSTDIFLNVLPGKIIDAISMGTIPVTNLGGYAEKIICENKLGIASKDADADTLIHKIINLKLQPKLQEEMQINAINYRNNNLIWEDNLKKLENFLLEGVDIDRNL